MPATVKAKTGSLALAVLLVGALLLPRLLRHDRHELVTVSTRDREPRRGRRVCAQMFDELATSKTGGAVDRNVERAGHGRDCVQCGGAWLEARRPQAVARGASRPV